MIAMAPAPKKPAQQQSELTLGLPGMLAHNKFPGRTNLTIPEVARVLEIDAKHLIDLIREGIIGAIEITGRGNLSSRERWKIPVEAYDDFVRRRSNTPEGKRES